MAFRNGNISGLFTLIPILAGCTMMNHETMKDPSTVPIPSLTGDALFVVNGGSASLSVLDASTAELVGTIELKEAAYPHHIYLSPDGMSLALAAPGIDLSEGHGGGHGSHGHGGTRAAIFVLNPLTGRTIAARHLEKPNHNAVFSPDGKEIWTAEMTGDGKALVLDAATLVVKHSIPVGNMPAEITFSWDGKYAFVANGESNDVTIIDASSKAKVKTIPVGKGPVAAWPGSNGLMYVDNEAGKSLTIIDAGSLEIISTVDLGFMPGMAALAPNGELWVTDSENGKVVFYSQDGDTRLGELVTGPGAHAIAFSEDGSTGYVSNQASGTLSIIALASREVTKNMAVGRLPNGLLFRAGS